LWSIIQKPLQEINSQVNSIKREKKKLKTRPKRKAGKKKKLKLKLQLGNIKKGT